MKFRQWLNERPHHHIGLRLLRISIGLLIFFRFTTESKFAMYLWSSNGIADGTSTFTFGKLLGENVDSIFKNETTIYVSIFFCLLASVGFIVNRMVLISNLILLILFYSFDNRLYLLGDGGDNITRIILFYLLFTINKNSKINLRIWFHNIAICAIVGQLIIVYLVSGLMKTWGDKWVLGVATYHINQVQWFSMPNLKHAYDNPIIATLSCYFSMIYQILFPVAVFSTLRIPWIISGIIFHLFIAYYMGLFTFSCVMIGLELFLIKDREYSKIKIIITDKTKQFNNQLIKIKL